MKKHLIASIFFNSVLSLSAFASELDAKHTLLEQRWYSFSEVIEKRKKYDMVDISRGSSNIISRVMSTPSIPRRAIVAASKILF